MRLVPLSNLSQRAKRRTTGVYSALPGFFNTPDNGRERITTWDDNLSNTSFDQIMLPNLTEKPILNFQRKRN